jgi:hypothetical protein
MTDDGRIPVRFAEAATVAPDEALLMEGDGAVAAGAAVAWFQPAGLGMHAPGCACCAARGPAAEALGRLFLARARGEVAPFRAVVAVARTPAGRRAVMEALTRDPLVAGRFRAAG